MDGVGDVGQVDPVELLPAFRQIRERFVQLAAVPELIEYPDRGGGFDVIQLVELAEGVGRTGSAELSEDLSNAEVGVLRLIILLHFGGKGRDRLLTAGEDIVVELREIDLFVLLSVAPDQGEAVFE